MYTDQVIYARVYQHKYAKCLQLLTNYLHYNGLEFLEDLDTTPLDIVQGVHKGTAHGGYLPLAMLGALVSVKFLFTLSKYYLVIP